jgi:hypothetical protein
MTQATARPTAAQIQKNQARADRKAAALARRNDDYRNDAGFVKAYAYAETTKTAKQTNTLAAIIRRLDGRLAQLKALGRGYNDAHLFLLEAVVANYTNQELKQMGQGQTPFIVALDKVILAELGLEETRIDGAADDDQSGQNPYALFMFVEDSDVAFVKDYINQLIIDRKAA